MSLSENSATFQKLKADFHNGYSDLPEQESEMMLYALLLETHA